MLVKVQSIDIHKSVTSGEVFVVGTALVDADSIVTVRPIVSLAEQDGTCADVNLPGSLLSFGTTSNDRSMYIEQSPEEFYSSLVDAGRIY
jgi:hypothetical protein